MVAWQEWSEDQPSADAPPPCSALLELGLSLGSCVLKIRGCRWHCVLPSIPLLSVSVFVDLTSHACPCGLGFRVSVFLLLVFSYSLTWLQAHTPGCCCVRISEAHPCWGSAQNPSNTKWPGPGSSACSRNGQGPDGHGGSHCLGTTSSSSERIPFEWHRVPQVPHC